MNSSTNALERGEDKEKKNRKRKASTIEPTASGYVSPMEDDKFGSESIIVKENGWDINLQLSIFKSIMYNCT